MLFVSLSFALLALILSALLFRHQRLLTYLAAAAALWQGLWLLTGFVHRAYIPLQAPEPIYTMAAVMALAIAVTLIKKFRMPAVFTRESLTRDVVILPVVALLLTAAWLVTQANYQQGSNWVTHGFFNGDTLTFTSLIQRSRLTEGLLTTNPLAGNGNLEYPTLLHGTIADILQLSAAPWEWFGRLPLFTYLQILIITPLFFLLADIALPPPAKKWLFWLGVPSTVLVLVIQALIITGVMALSWDHFIYPQSHFFLFGIFLVGVSALAVASSASGTAQWLPLSVGTVCVALLYIANAVTGTAALALLGILCLLRMNAVNQLLPDRVKYGLLLIGCGAWFFLWTPGESGFGHFHFSYIAAYDMLRLSLVVAVTIAAGWLGRGRQKFLALGTIGLCVLALLLFLFSNRPIVVDNASRFFYHGLVVGSPLLLPLVIQIFFWIRRQLFFTSQMLVETVFGTLAVGIVMMLFAVLPAGSSVVSAMDNLVYRDMQITPDSTLTGLRWLHDHTPADAIIIASPQPPWAIPMFAGRSLLRAQDYWLSPQDFVTSQLVQAFAGNAQAQQAIIQQGDYLLLSTEERKLWSTDLPLPVFTSASVTIYDLREIIDPL